MGIEDTTSSHNWQMEGRNQPGAGADNRRTREGTQEVWGGSGQPDFHENVWKSATERGRKVENTFCNGALNSLYAKPGLTLLG